MKNLSTPALICLILFLTYSCAINKTQEKKVDIHLQINGLSSTWIYLNDVHENVKSTRDSAAVDINGNAYFKRDELYDQGAYSIILPDSIVLEMLLDEDQVFTMQTDFNQTIEDMQVTGSTENELLYKNMQYDINLNHRFQEAVGQLQQNSDGELDQEAINQLRETLFSERDNFVEKLFKEHPHTLFTKLKLAGQEPEVLQTIIADQSIDNDERQYLMLDHYWDMVDFNTTSLLHTPVIFERLLSYMYNYGPNQTTTKLQAIDILLDKVAKHPDYYRFFATWIAESYKPEQDANLDREAIYVHMVDYYLTHERAVWADSTQVYAWQLRAGIRASSLIGKKGANIEAEDPAGNIQSLYDIEAPYIAIFFYHAECDHCIEAAPKLVKIYETYKDLGLEVMAVAVDTEDDKWKDFIKEHKMNWINVTDKDNPSISENYYRLGTPYVYLLDSDRTIIAKDLTIEDVPRAIQMNQQMVAANH